MRAERIDSKISIRLRVIHTELQFQKRNIVIASLSATTDRKAKNTY